MPSSDPLHGDSDTAVTGIFARADHPNGWGWPNADGGGAGRAHGYVLLFVDCPDNDALKAVEAKLSAYPDGFQGLEDQRQYSHGFMGEWFGGRFDYIGVTERVPILSGVGRFQPRGDNRFVGIFTAAEVLGADT